MTKEILAIHPLLSKTHFDATYWPSHRRHTSRRFLDRWIVAGSIGERHGPELSTGARIPRRLLLIDVLAMENWNEFFQSVHRGGLCPKSHQYPQYTVCEMGIISTMQPQSPKHRKPGGSFDLSRTISKPSVSSMASTFFFPDSQVSSLYEFLVLRQKRLLRRVRKNSD